VWWHPLHNPPPKIINYKVYYNYTNYSKLINKKGGTAILVREDIESVEVEAPDREASSSTWARVFTKQGSFIIGSCYHQEKEGESVRALEASLKEFTGKVIIAGDFNAHAHIWDNKCKQVNAAGRILEQYVEDFNLLVHNDPDIPTHDPKGDKNKSVIDLILTTVAISPFVSCRVLKDIPEAHHRPLLTTVNTSILRDELTLREASWRVHAADEKAYAEECETIFKEKQQELLEETSPHQLAEKIREAVNLALRKTVPRTKITKLKKGQKRQPWWNKTIEKLVRFCRKARRYAQRFPNSKGIKKRYTNLFRRRLEAIRQAQAVFQEKKWKEYSRKPQQFLWKTVKEAIGQQTTSYPPLNNGTVIDKKEKAEVFLKNYKEVSERTAKVGAFDEPHKLEVQQYLELHKEDFSVQPLQVDYNSKFRQEELEHALKRLKKSAVGPDGIPNWAYKNAPLSLRGALLALFNLSFSRGEFPESFSYADIVSLPKAGKDHTLPKNYRPISLTNTLARIFESVVHKRLYAYCEIHRILPPSQFAYRHNNSSIDPLILLTQDIKHGFHNSFATEMLQLDITKAFDTVWLDGLKYKLHKIGLRNHMLAWIASYVERRKYRVITPEKTEFEEFSDGVPQGSCLSPLLFTIFLSDIASQLRCKHAEFADDFTLWRTIDNKELAEEDLKHDLRVIEQWSAKWRISFGDKCSHTLFYGHHSKRSYKLNLMFNGKELKSDEEPRLLGLNLDPMLTYKRHIKILVTKLKQKIGIFHKIVGSKLGSVRSYDQH